MCEITRRSYAGIDFLYICCLNVLFFVVLNLTLISLQQYNFMYETPWDPFPYFLFSEVESAQQLLYYRYCIL